MKRSCCDTMERPLHPAVCLCIGMWRHVTVPEGYKPPEGMSESFLSCATSLKHTPHCRTSNALELPIEITIYKPKFLIHWEWQRSSKESLVLSWFQHSFHATSHILHIYIFYILHDSLLLSLTKPFVAHDVRASWVNLNAEASRWLQFLPAQLFP